jgi:hypothetical protein
MLNKSLKSELTNILALHFCGMENHLPGGSEPHLGRLGLPELQVK